VGEAVMDAGSADYHKQRQEGAALA